MISAEAHRLMRLADRMRDAARLLEEVSELYEAAHPEHYQWSASRLRHEAEMVESEAVEL